MKEKKDRRVALHNLGCKVNAYELEAVQERLEDAGYAIVPFAPGADIYIINTCTVTNIADKKSRQMLHKARKMNPDAVVIAMGCYVDTGEEKVKKDPAIDLVIGNKDKKNIVEILSQAVKETGCAPAPAYGREPENTVPDRKRPENSAQDRKHLKSAELSLTRRTDHTRAYIKVQDGCNQFCSYCIIPYARGRVRSRELSDVVREVKRLAAAGYKEVVLTGIHLSSYGIELPGHTHRLLELIRAVHAVDGICRIRLGSLEPRIVDAPFAEALSKLWKVCPHFHLSLQSGCDATLARMNRRYTAREYAISCEILRKYFDHPALTTDVIVGFPMETEEEFAETFRFIDGIGFFETHIFKYSRRKGTKADAMDGQIQEAVKQERSARLIALGKAHRRAYMEHYIGRCVEVLPEETVEVAGKRYEIGHTKEYVRVAVPLTGTSRKNTLVSVTPEAFTEDFLV